MNGGVSRAKNDDNVMFLQKKNGEKVIHRSKQVRWIPKLER
jgi:hypothetical protein